MYDIIIIRLTSEEDLIVNGGVQAHEIRHDEGEEVGGHGDGSLVLVPHPALLVRPAVQHTLKLQCKTHTHITEHYKYL